MWRIGYCGFTIMGVIDFPFDRIWKLKNVVNFDELFTVCWNMPLIGLQKNFWLVAIAASC
ncbi:hypothetical protein Goari_015279 [Gossypium aridum]|uniref:Uncharacterized protein n=1 Tax=Gossypium aridum TaxID=34290 RepID=A0A7J8XKR2_GOSAI|nr:hypothetical protein [Gossypium aridum]